MKDVIIQMEELDIGWEMAKSRYEGEQLGHELRTSLR